MHSPKYIRENIEMFKERLSLRGFDISLLNEFIDLDLKLRNVETKIIELNTLRNELIKKGSLENRNEIKKLKEEISKLEDSKHKVSSSLNNIIWNIPNLPDLSLTDKGEEIKKWGDEKKFFFKPLSHQELAKKHNLFNLESGSIVSGTGYVVYEELGAKLYRALIDFTLDINIKNGYKERWLPVIVNQNTLFGTGQLPKFKEDLFLVSDNKYLSPTSETQLVNLYRDKLLKSDSFPIKMTANTTCFRREAGSAGMETAGIIRLHQFSKTELVVLCKPEDSWNYLEQMVIDASSILEKLNLTYRVLQLAYDDMGFSAAKTYDIEVWFPSESRYREISSVSNTLDFQSRRSNIKYKNDVFDKKESTKYPHALNGSSLAIDRLFAAILDNYQQEDGSIIIPEALHKYMGIKDIK